jgi:ribonuclease P/MRP protein subunit POP5
MVAIKKIKPVLPSLREKKRYLVFEIISKSKIDSKKVSKTILDGCRDYLGEMGMAKAGLLMLNDKYNKEEQKGIIKVNNKMVDHLRAALCFIKKIDNQKVIVRSIGMSGILKKAQAKFMTKKQGGR